MGSSKAERIADSPETPSRIQSVRALYASTLQRCGFHPHSPFLIAFSGGLDSSVLLDLAIHYAAAPQTRIRVVHVHHGLNVAADQWRDHCQQVCLQAGVAFHAAHVQLDLAGGNLEAQARTKRYAAMLQHLRDGETLLLAHHRGDTAETFFLNLMRGAGVRGLSGIPVEAARDGGRLFRPLKDVSRTELLEYARLRNLTWVEDDSNADQRFDRNYLRHEIMPALVSRWPEAEAAINRASENLFDASALLDEVAAADLVAASVDEQTPFAIHSVKLSADHVKGLTPARRKNLIQHVLRKLAIYSPGRQFMQKLIAMIDSAENNKQLKYARWIIHLYGEHLYFYREEVAAHPASPVHWNIGQRRSLDWGTYRITVDAPRELELLVQTRSGGEKLKLAGRQYRHSLKKLLQSKGVPPWERALMPLIWHDGVLVAAPGFLQPSDMADPKQLEGITFHLERVR